MQHKKKRVCYKNKTCKSATKLAIIEAAMGNGGKTQRNGRP